MPEPLDTRTGAVQGDLIQWARTQQAVTMREIRERGGPCLGYQSEVEHCKKTEVHSDILTTWISLLNVTEAFARGQVPRYHENPVGCRGLAGDIALIVRSGRADLPDWRSLSVMERTRRLLKLVANESQKLPRVVLAHVLGVELETLDAMIQGNHPIMLVVREALEDLTTLPPEFFKHGNVVPVFEVCEQFELTPERVQEFLPAIQQALRLGLSGEQVERLISGG